MYTCTSPLRPTCDKEEYFKLFTQELNLLLTFLSTPWFLSQLIQIKGEDGWGLTAIVLAYHQLLEGDLG